jgi:membrane-associated phospholipid phosphatase
MRNLWTDQYLNTIGLIFAPMFLLQSQGPGSWIDGIVNVDRWVMFKVNAEWHSTALDALALLAREATLWAPLYVFLIVYMALNYGGRGWWWVVTAMVLVGVSDLVASHFFKVVFYRPRPCRDEFMSQHIRFIAQVCGLNGSFVSSHASNHFAMATFIQRTLGRNDRRWSLFYFWAMLICWAQVYVGVHYPTDVLGGALLGLLIGWLGARLFRSYIGLTNPSEA